MTLSRPARAALWITAIIVVVLSIAATVLARRFEPIARNYVISTLRHRYKSDVELGALQVSLFPAVHATADNLVLHLTNRTDVPPMVIVRRLTIDARLSGLLGHTKRIQRVRLEGLQLHIPPQGAATVHSGNSATPFVLEEVIADGATLETLPASSGKDPLTFAIHKLALRSVGPGLPMTFHADLDNAKPPGLIHSDGSFGPWNPDDPGGTPVSGKYTFNGADLSVFRGIRGMLNSTGDYRGQLSRIDVHGVTDVPAFSLTTGGRALPLHTEFDATVDGVNGNTDLHPVRARLGNSAFEVTGAIERHALETHKEIDLEAHAKNTRIEDFLRLTVPNAPTPLKGTIGFDAGVKIPPGEAPVIQRMQLAGRFTLHNITFTSADVQQKVSNLSHHAEGRPKETDTDVAAQFAGNFSIRSGLLTLPKLTFDVPGANVTLDGTYGLKSGDIDFHGTARLDARLSQMTTGIKHILLRPINPLFSRDGDGTVVPIQITGTRNNPSFHLQIGRALKEDALH